ncbi:MAG: GNAT family N-acetyltransferase [Lagierella massiliensis]|nr:GNAT family N-acetyltransferase [Lagierella massiliensis]
MNDLLLYIPKIDDLYFYQKMLADSETMAYNASWFPPDGCIDFPKNKWKNWYYKWVNQVPRNFFAYLRLKEAGTFVGYVNYYYNSEKDWWDMGIVILGSERGKGYGKEGLFLLVDQAFKTKKITRLHNTFETTRKAAYHIHKAVGFKDMETEDENIHHIVLTKDKYFESKLYRDCSIDVKKK